MDAEKAATRPQGEKPQEEQAFPHLDLGPQPLGPWETNLSFKPPACGSLLWGPSKHSGHPKPSLGVLEPPAKPGSGGYTLWRVRGPL